MASEAVRRTSARIAAHTKWSRTDRVSGTSAARAAFLKRFEDEVDPDRSLSPEERQKRAASAKSAYFVRMAKASARARAGSTPATAVIGEGQ